MSLDNVVLYLNREEYKNNFNLLKKKDFGFATYLEKDSLDKVY